MSIRKRRHPTPAFGALPPYQPITGERAPLKTEGVYPYCSMMQVAAEDTKLNYVICRGFDTRIGRFIDYEEGNDDSPGIPVAKPFGNRRIGAYNVAEIYAAGLPLQSSNASPSSVPWRVGQNPGVSETTEGHPEDLDETVDELYTDEGQAINWMFIESPSPGEVFWCVLLEDHPGRGECFNIAVGVWCKAEAKHRFDCSEIEIGIDWHNTESNGGSLTEPDAGARGWFKRESCPSTDSGWIYVVVSLDCESPGECGTDDDALNDGECPEGSGDPCS
jgi:hypothetical protein